MNRLKLFAAATLMALTFTACDEGTPPPVEPPPPPTPVGTISGTVTIEGTAASGIAATLSSGATTTTGSGGSFAFSGVEAGTYTVTISGFPEDATFAQVTQSATIATDGQNVQLNFAGEYVRSSAVVGNVVAADAMMSGGDGQPETLAGVTVTLGGEHAMGETMETDMSGGFAFTGLRAGTYTVTISDFPEDVSFETVSLEIQVDVGDVGQADFTGHFIRTSAVEGQVIIEGEGLAGITVTLSGGPADESYTMMTDGDGMFRFEELRPGDYRVEIADFDPRDYEFAATSQDVSVDLDETGTVSFTGVLLRTSGIAGGVSVEGMGLGDIAVTLAGGDESRTTMTDAGGQYAFAGLAAGDYTVSIAVESDAYVFESMSTDVTLGDDESAIVNFEGAHARTASVSGMVFIDEATKNDMYDEGEHSVAHAGIPVALVGPGVNEQRLGATDETGAFSFTGLRAGPYQLVVLINADVAAALAAADLAYGGPGEGYSVDLGVGEPASQAIPFDITHTTVNFTVSLRNGDDMGDAVPGATVTLYGTGDGMVGSGTTDDDGSVTIKVARARTDGNMVTAGVSAEGYDYGEDARTAVSWDPQMFATAAGNSNDIVNLNVDASVSGATVTTEYGGGEALAGWAISVMSGDEAVDGAPEMLDDMGNAAFMTTVGADDLPATFTVALADDQDNALDGGENYSAQPVEYTHTGLMLAGTQDAGMLEAAFTTQTLKVYVHHELDQVEGYTGNIIGGDEMDGKGADRKVDVEVRYIDDSGRSRPFTAADSISEPRNNGDGGAWVFNNVPADMNVIAQASKADNSDQSIMLLDEGGHADELAAYAGTETNGITGGHFGAQGGYSHTVSLCPLQATKPQDHGDCSSFAYVSTHSVTGLIWKNQVLRSSESANDDGFKMGPEDDGGPTFVPGISVSLSPVEGKNLAGDEESATTTEKPVRGPGETSKGNEVLDETHQFAFNNIAAGVYEASVTDGWRARMGPKGATAMVGSAFSPLAGDVELDITPATTTVYGYVRDAEEFPVPDVTVNVNGVEAMTDAHGRYIAEYVPNVASRKIGSVTHTNSVFVETAHEGSGKTREIVPFAANDRINADVDLSGVGATASISGTVTASGSGAPIAGAEIMVDGAAPTNAATTGANAGKLVTGADGTYTATITAKDLGESAAVTVSKDGMSFAPAELSVPAHAGSAVSGINFTGFLHATISGRVRGPDNTAMGGVTVTATNVVPGAAGDDVSSTSTARGTFVLSVPFGTYDIEASAANHVFGYPNDNQRVSVAPGQAYDFGTIRAMTAGARNVSAARMRVDDDDATDDVDESTRAWATTISVMYTANAEHTPDGYNDATYTIQTSVDDGDTWTDVTSPTQVQAGTPLEDVPGSFTIPNPSDGEFMVRVIANAEEVTPSTPAVPYADTSAAVTVDEIDPSASGVAAVRDDDDIEVSWNAVTNGNSQFRILVEVDAASAGNTLWLVAAGGTPATLGSETRAWTLPVADGFTATWSTLGGVPVPITEADLNKAIKVRVDARQEGVDEGEDGSTDTWTEERQGTVVSVDAKPSS